MTVIFEAIKKELRIMSPAIVNNGIISNSFAIDRNQQPKKKKKKKKKKNLYLETRIWTFVWHNK